MAKNYTPNSEKKMISKTGIDNWNAPELINGSFYTNKIDIWGAGCVFFYAMTGEFPFADPLIAVLHKKITTRQLETRLLEKFSPS